MKRLLILLFVLTELISYGQAIIGMSPVFSFTPASAITPSSTVTYTTSVSFKVYIKNTGNVGFNGWINLSSIRDTTNGVLCDSIFVSVNIAPGDSTPAVLTFTPSPGGNAFKTGGNGNTIVVWPIAAFGVPLIYGDSVRPVIWVNDVNSVYEFEKNQFRLYPNPVEHELTIKSQSTTTYKKIIIYDVFARKIKEMLFKETIDVSELTSGSYWMIINSENKAYRIPFIKE